MEQDTARQLFEAGAFYILLDAPRTLEFGVDFHTWDIGPKFKGLKMLPPGLHFVYYSAAGERGATGMRSGIFYVFESKEIMLNRWSPESEEAIQCSEEDTARVRENIKDLDASLGAYPLTPPTSYRQWRRLTSYISPSIVERVLPNKGQITSAMGSKYDDDELKEAALTGTEEQLHFTYIDVRKSFPAGSAADQVTRYSRDKSFLLGQLLKQLGDYKVLLGELQLSFLCLVLGQNFSGLEQWKRIIQLICGSAEALVSMASTLFVDFIEVLQNQLAECPPDFFSDIVLQDNFVAVMLTKLMSNVDDYADEVGEDDLAPLRQRIGKFQAFMLKRFDWKLEADPLDHESGEDAPVIVDM